MPACPWPPHCLFCKPREERRRGQATYLPTAMTQILSWKKLELWRTIAGRTRRTRAAFKHPASPPYWHRLQVCEGTMRKGRGRRGEEGNNNLPLFHSAWLPVTCLPSMVSTSTCPPVPVKHATSSMPYDSSPPEGPTLHHYTHHFTCFTLPCHYIGKSGTTPLRCILGHCLIWQALPRHAAHILFTASHVEGQRRVEADMDTV